MIFVGNERLTLCTKFVFNIPTEDFDKLLMIDVIQSNWRDLLNK